MALTKIPSSLLDTSGGFDLQGNITLGDNEKIILGDSSDLQIYHNGSNSYIDDAGTGALNLRSSGIYLEKANGAEVMISAIADGAVTLYHDGSIKLATSSTGVSITGNIALGDSEEVKFGDSDDLRIYHDGTNSYIDNATGSGDLFIRGQGDDLILRANDDIFIQPNGNDNGISVIGESGVNIFHNGNQKFQTTAAGATITGTLTVTGDLDITGDINSTSVNDLDVVDKTITLGAGQTEANSGGSGIIVDGSNASILWNETDTAFDINNPINFDKTNASGGGDHDFVIMGYNGSWSNNSGGIAGIQVNDGSGVVGRYGITYATGGGRFVVTDLFDSNYGASGDVFWVRGDGQGYLQGKLGINTTTNHAGSGLGYGLTIDSGATNGSGLEIHRTGNSRFELYQNSTGGQYLDALGTTPFMILATGGTERLRVTNTGIVDIGKNAFSSYPTGGQLNVYADGEGIRLDGTANTTRRIRFRNAGAGTGPGEIVADGSLIIKNEDPNAYLNFSSIRNIEYTVTSGNATAGHHIFNSYNTEIMRIDGANNRIGIRTGSTVSSALHIDQPSNNQAGGIYIERDGSNYGLSLFVDSGGYGIIGGNGDFTPSILRLDFNQEYVGIGTNPSFPLDVNGKIYSTSEVQGGTAIITNNNTFGALLGSNSSSRGIVLARDANPSSYPDLVITAGGHVGIGASSPGSGSSSLKTFTVNGAIMTTNSTASSGTVYVYEQRFNGSNNLTLGYVANGSTHTAAQVASQNNLPLVFTTGGSERIGIDNAGRIFMGADRQTSTDMQAVVMDNSLHNKREFYHGGNMTHYGRTFKYRDGSTGTFGDAIKIDWNNPSWGAVNMRIKGQGYYGNGNAVDVVIGFQGYNAYSSVSYSAVDNGTGTWSNFIQLAQTATGETTIRIRNHPSGTSNTEDIIFMFEWVTNNRSDQQIKVIEL